MQRKPRSFEYYLAYFREVNHIVSWRQHPGFITMMIGFRGDNGISSSGERYIFVA